MKTVITRRFSGVSNLAAADNRRPVQVRSGEGATGLAAVLLAGAGRHRASPLGRNALSETSRPGYRRSFTRPKAGPQRGFRPLPASAVPSRPQRATTTTSFAPELRSLLRRLLSAAGGKSGGAPPGRTRSRGSELAQNISRIPERNSLATPGHSAPGPQGTAEPRTRSAIRTAGLWAESALWSSFRSSR